LHRVLASVFEIIECRVEIEPIPGDDAVDADRLRHDPVVNQPKKGGSAQGKVGGRSVGPQRTRLISQ
jgi:hypothetical protein